MELSPFKTHAIAAHTVLSHGEKKLRQSKSSFITKQNELQKHLAESLEVQPDDLKLSSENESTSNKSLKKKSKDFDNFMSLVKAKMKTSSHAQIIQLLTLVPVSWTYDEIIEEYLQLPTT